MSDLPPAWEVSRLGLIAEARMGKTILSRQLVDQGLPVFSASVGSNPWGHTSERDVVFYRGTIVISARGTIGDIKVPDFDEFVSTQTTIALSPSAAIDPHFLAHQLRVYDWPAVTATTAIPMLTIGKLDDISVAVPPLEEQRRIVAKLEALIDRTAIARTDLDRIPALAAHYKRAVLAAAFSGALTSGWRAENGVMWPTDRHTVASLCSPSAPICYGVIQPGSARSDGVPLVRVCDLADGAILWRNLRTVAPEIDAEYSRSRVLDGDVLVSIVGTIGRVALVKGALPGTNIARAIARIRPNPENALGSYISYALQAPEHYAVLVSESREVARKTLNLEQLRSVEIPVPSLPEQAELVRRISSAFAEIDRLTAESASARRLLDRLDQAILAKAFRGELVPQDPTDEPASAMLERINEARSVPIVKARRGRRAAM